MTFATACKSLLVGLVSFSALSACSPSGSSSGEGVVNVYTARHYASDDALYEAFTEHTGIEVNVIEAPGDLLIERVRADGDRSQADVVITVDAGRLWRVALPRMRSAGSRPPTWRALPPSIPVAAALGLRGDRPIYFL